ncbi:TonB-dependent receptor [Lewinella sp. 4G2]|uniref:TonB-dependent receptor n=1 Tax=Lewinella sp. 4G2 TaxID=1803372 RepID=UPI0007B4A18E|nr:TonB-dependent receptor [Lewinella sp. 4G2]OAV44715.1 hypothetical protein A3850_009525 [Lewinella sp. 4G2]
MLRSFLLLVVMLTVGTLAYGQQGAISGTVLDEDGFPVLGANVVIQGTTIGAQTDFIEGKFQFQVDPGTYTIVATYVGYADLVTEGVVVAANETTVLDLSFNGDTGVDLDLDVTVSAKALERGDVAVLRLRQNSDKVQDVISSQEMSRLGAGNAAAAMSKVTGTTIVDGKYVYVRGLGDRYSATTVNGLRLPSVDPYRNAAQLDLIPTNLLDNIVASKTFTPDLPGDFTGGSVNIKLKALPERFTWGVSASTSYNTLSNFQSDFLTYDAGDKSWLGFNDGTLDRPAILDDPRREELFITGQSAVSEARRNDDAAALLDETTRAFAPNGFTQTNNTSPLDYSFSANIGNQFQIGTMPVGVFATASYSRDYSFQDGTRANFFASPGNDQLIRNFDLRDQKSVESPKIGGMLGVSLRPSNASTINLYSIYSHQAFIEGRSLRGANDDFGVAGNQENFFQSNTSSFTERALTSYVAEGSHVLKGLGNTKIEWAGNVVNSVQNEPDIRFLAYVTQGGSSQINQSEITLPSRFFRDLTDDSYQGKLDITIPFLQSKSRGNAIKFGGLYNTKDRDFNETSYQYARSRGIDFNEANSDPAVYFGSDNLGLLNTDDRGNNFFGLYAIDATNQANSYVGSSDIYAGYLMGTYEVTKRLKVIAGLRMEGTAIDVISDKAEVSTNPEDFIANIDTTSFLPALNLVYKIGDGENGGLSSNLRASFTQTIARPNMREIAPFGSFGFIGEPPVFGNPDLQLTSIDNYDIRYELFPKAGEVIAISAFYKKFRNPIVVTFRQAGEQQFTWTNSETADLYGIELELRKNLGSFTSALENLTFSSNFSFIQSQQSIDAREVEIGQTVDPDFEAERQFNGQSPFIANVNLSYQSQDESPWDAVIAFNYFGDRLASIGAVGSPDIFERGRGTLDFSVGKKLGNFKLTLRGRNLLNPAYERFSEFNNSEYIFSRYDRGREVSLGVSYGL